MLKVAGGGVATGTLSYQGTWNANTNTPTLTSSVGTINNYYVVSVAGTTNLNGITDWQVNDWAIFNGSVWQKIDQSDLVTSVNGQTGAVSLVVGDIPGAVPNTVNVLTSGLASGGGPLTGNVTITVNDIPVANVTGAVPNTRTVSAGGLLSGGGNLASNVTISLTDVPLANVTGAGTMASQNANAVAITGGTINNTSQIDGTYANVNITSVVSTFPNSYLTNSAVTIGNTSVSLGGTITSVGNLTLANVTISSGSVTANVTTSNLDLTGTTSANATFVTSSLPLVPEGYISVNIGGVAKKIPYYGV